MAKSIARHHIDDIRQWAAEELSLSEMARRLGSKRTTIRRLIEKHEIPYQFLGFHGRPGKLHPCWKGGRMVEKPEGYILIHQPEHPHANRHGYVREHRLVVEAHIGRYLDRSEVVHHKNGVRDDNRIENLEVFGSNAEHLRHELKGKCPNWSEEGLAKLQAMNRNRDHLGRLMPISPHPKTDAHP